MALSTLLVAAALDGVERASVWADGVQRVFYVQYPEGTPPAAGWPMVWSFHGTGVSASQHATYDGPLRSYARRSAIVVHCEGWPMGSPREPQSWHGGGSAGADVDGGTDGPICNPASVRAYVCYSSCEERGHCTKHGPGANRCRYSHCKDDVAFVLAALAYIKKAAPVDDSRIYGTGDSNGGVFLYELASDPRTASVFSAIAPVCGLPSNGFNRGTLNPRMRCLQLEGTMDSFIYPFPNVDSDRTKSYGKNWGWYYSSIYNTSDLWAVHKGLPPRPERGLKRLRLADGRGLECYGWSPDDTAERAELAECFYKAEHCYPPHAARTLVWRFFGLGGKGSAAEL